MSTTAKGIGATRTAAPAPNVMDDYVRFCVGIQSLAGLDLLQYKREQMERRLRSFAQRLGMASLSDYLVVLQRDEPELERFLDRVTINVSQLWRNPEQWAAIAKDVLPELASTRRIKIWSAGCSYGAECYTIAGVCLESAPGVNVEIKGTDIDPRMLARAKAGIFSQEDTRTVPAASLKRWFVQTEEGGWSAKPELHKVISFERGNLLTATVPKAAYDLVLCRNVVIYFTEDVRNELHRRLALSLRSGGYLVVGSTERVSDAEGMGLTLTQPFTYRKA